MILSLYIARRFAWMITRIFLIFLGIMMLIDMLDQLRRFSDQGISLAEVTWLAAMNVPSSLYRILPLILILSAIAMFLGLARSSELVVVRAAGQSGLRFLVTPVVVSLGLGAFAIGVLNPLVAATSKQYDVLWSQYSRGTSSTLSISEEGLWLRQRSADGQTVIHAARANLDGTELIDVTFLSFGADGMAQTRVDAAEATLVPGEWAVKDAKKWDLRSANPEAGAAAIANVSLPSDLTRDAIRDSFGTPSAIQIWDLPGYIAQLEQAGFSARSHRVWFQMELAQPLLLAAMVLMAAGFTMRHARFSNTGTMVLMALAAGFGTFFLRNFAQVLGDNGQIPVAMAAWTPPIAAILLAMGLLLHVEDG
jgi:lipopolysaccharide export system permease protein